MSDSPPPPPENPYGQPPQGPPAGGQPPSQPPSTPPGTPYGEPPQGPPPPPPPGGGPPPPGGAYGAPGYSVGDALSYGWEKFKGNPGPFVVMLLILVAASVAVSLPFGVLSAAGESTIDSDSGNFALMGATSGLQLVGQFLSSIVSMVLSGAVVNGALKTTRGQRVGIGDMFDGLPWANVIIAGIIIGIASTIGFILCILPGLVVYFLTMWTQYFVIGHGQSAIEAIQSSFKLATGRFGDSIITWIVTGLVAIVGVCACVVGLLVTVPIAILSLAWAFRTLTGERPV